MDARDPYSEDEQDFTSEARYRNKEKRVGYVPVSNALIRLFSSLPDAALRTYLTLCSYAFGRGETFVGQETLCRIRGAHLSTIIKHINSLRDAGLVSVERRGQGKTNIYIIEDIPEKALDEYILTFIGGNDHATVSSRANSGAQKREVLTSQKREVKTSRKRKIERTRGEKQEQQQPSSHSLQTSDQPSAPNVVVVVADELRLTDDEILTRLRNIGIAPSTATSLLKRYEASAVYRWVAYIEHKLATGWVPRETPAAWLVTAIRSGDWVIPDWFRTPEETAADRAEEAKVATRQRLQYEQEAEQEREAAEQQRQATERQLGVDDRTKATWDQVKGVLHERNEMTPALFSAFLLPINGTAATIVTPVEFFCRVIRQHVEPVRRALEQITGRSVETIEVEHVDLDPSEAAT